MTESQHFIPIKDISGDLVYLQDGSVTLVLTTSAVNFGLLFETEQLGIIDSFARLLNSLSFPIQIVIHSRRLDVSSYLHTLDRAINNQQNPQLKTLSIHYRQFVESTIKERNVLDKQFYVCLNVSAPELGILPKSAAEHGKKALTLLAPRRDHLISQLTRLGLKSRQLNSAELIKVFYDAYNPPSNEITTIAQDENLPEKKVLPLARISTPLPPQPLPQPKPVITLARLTPAPKQPDIYHPPVPQQSAATLPPITTRLVSPFVVEELSDDYGP